MYGYMEMGPGDDIPESDFLSKMPPTCIIHGDDDKTVNIERAETVASLLDQYGIPHEYHVLPGAGHAFIYGEENAPVRNQAMDIAIDFLDSQLKP